MSGLSASGICCMARRMYLSTWIRVDRLISDGYGEEGCVTGVNVDMSASPRTNRPVGVPWWWTRTPRGP
jgi:hypothetical protein